MSLEALERKVDSIECRVRVVEVNDAKMDERVDALIKRLDHLSKWIMALVIVLITSTITGIGGLLVNYIKGGTP